MSISKIRDAFEISLPEWFITGKGEMCSLCVCFFRGVEPCKFRESLRLYMEMR